MEMLALLVIDVLIIVVFFQVLKNRYLEEMAVALIRNSNVMYKFQIRRIRENSTSFSLYGLDDIEVRISKEDFVTHEVQIGKFWIYDGTHYRCLSPDDIFSLKE